MEARRSLGSSALVLDPLGQVRGRPGRRPPRAGRPPTGGDDDDDDRHADTSRASSRMIYLAGRRHWQLWNPTGQPRRRRRRRHPRPLDMNHRSGHFKFKFGRRRVAGSAFNARPIDRRLECHTDGDNGRVHLGGRRSQEARGQDGRPQRGEGRRSKRRPEAGRAAAGRE